MQKAIILKENKFCKLKKVNSVSHDFFSLLIVHTSYYGLNFFRKFVCYVKIKLILLVILNQHEK